MTQQHTGHYRPLSRRIIIAFVLLVALVSGLFGLGIVLSVRYMETQLLTDTLHGDLAIALADLKAGRDIELEPGLSFYYGQDETVPVSNPPPNWLPPLDPGLHEVAGNDRVFHALVYRQDNQEYLLLRDQTDFEQREHILFMIVIAGFLLSILTAWLIGRWLARRVLAPVSQLAQDVREHESLRDTSLLAPRYADDEIGWLALAFDNTLGKLRDALTREQLFTSDVSHELRTPLMVISSAAELLSNANNLSERQREQTQRMLRASHQMRDLINTFLLLARDTSRTDSAADRITLHALAEEQLQHWRPAAEAKQLQCTLAIEHHNHTAHNAPLLRAVLSNLIRNAVHYTDNGFVRIVLMANGFRVEDSGPGIAPAQQETVFQPFVRGTQARGEGLGLGLSLVKRICAHEAWGITLSARAPHGSCFTVTLTPATP